MRNKINIIKKSFFSLEKLEKRGKTVFLFYLFGVKLKLTFKHAFCNRFFKYTLYSAPVPLVYENSFYYLKQLPVFNFQYVLKIDDCVCPKTAIILQGVINKDYNFTFETLKIYQKNFSNVQLILSTWNDEPADLIEKIKQIGVYVVQSNCTKDGIGNINRQIISTNEGLKIAKDLGCEYVLKTRTDQRLYANNVLEFLFNIQKQFPLDNDVFTLKGRLIALSFNSFKNRLYGVSDMFLFGHIDDVCAYWNIPVNSYHPNPVGKSDFEVFQTEQVETFVCRQFLKNIGEQVADTMEDTYRVYYKYFCFVDKETVEMYWPKYSNMNSRWEPFSNDVLEEIKFKDWLNLYYRKGINEEWCKRVCLEHKLPDLSS